jgi:hypothetical protein
MQITPLRRISTVLACAGIAMAATGCGDDSDDETRKPDPSTIPPRAVALVGDQPISKAEIDRRVATLRQGQRGSKPSPEQARQQALDLLIQRATLEQEAAERGVTVTEAEIDRRVKRARAQFPTDRGFKRFLGGQTLEDFRFQLRNQALSDAITDQAAEDGDDSEGLMEDVRKRWRAKTVCRGGYVAIACDEPADSR